MIFIFKYTSQNDFVVTKIKRFNIVFQVFLKFLILTWNHSESKISILNSVLKRFKFCFYNSKINQVLPLLKFLFIFINIFHIIHYIFLNFFFFFFYIKTIVNLGRKCIYINCCPNIDFYLSHKINSVLTHF